jgi:hypothetical protein
MAHGRAPERRDHLEAPRSEVQVTVIAESPRASLKQSLRALGHGSHIRGLAFGVAALAAVAAVAGAAVGQRSGWGTGRHQGLHAEAVVSHEAGAYRFPLGCLGARLAGGSQAYADAANRTGACSYPGVYVTAVLRRVNGVWHLSLEGHAKSCPRMRLPAPIRAILAACVKPDVGMLHSSRLQPPRAAAG